MAAAIKEATGIDATLIKGGGGIFDIKVDDQIIYSKKASGNQFPENDNFVVDAIKSLT